MNQLVVIFAFAILVSNILCDPNSNVHYTKCLEYRAEDELLDAKAKEAILKVVVLGKTQEGTVISPDTILLLSDVLHHEFTVHSFKVFLDDGNYNWIVPDNFYTQDRFIVLKMRELFMNRFPRRRACLPIEFPKNSELHVISYNGQDSLILTAIGICLKREHLPGNICDFNYIIPPRSTLNDSLVLLIKHSHTVIVGSFFEYDGSAKIKLIDEENIKWIESVTWNNNTNSVQQCGEVKLPLTPLISFGMVTRPGEFPWHAAIFRNTTYVCGGTIINTRTIMTAAHCVHNPRGIESAESFTVWVGLHNLLNRVEQGGQALNVDRVIPHEDYNSEFLDNNIAVLRLTTSIVYTNFVQPICVQSTVPANADVGIVPGWGKDEFGNIGNILRKGSLYVHPIKSCRQADQGFFRTYLSEANFCAGFGNGTNVCQGDSGGGMVVIEQDRWILWGIVSLGRVNPGTSSCDPTSLSLFTNTTFFYNWIVDKSG